ncbi:MAG: RNA polymerase sigma-70 factor [Bacteroidota bacterium]
MNKVFSKHDSTDDNLFSSIKQSDERAFRILYDRYWKALYAFAYSFTEDEDLSKDIVQEIWITFWDKRKNIDVKNVKAYLYSMVRNRVYNQLRDNKKLEHQLEIIDKYLTVDDITDLTDLADTNQLLEEAIAKLPERNREIFMLSRFEGLSNQEIADRLDISKRTVENHLTNSLRQIRKSVIVALLLASI